MPLATFAAWRLMVTLQETKSCLQGIHIFVDEYNPPHATLHCLHRFHLWDDHAGVPSSALCTCVSFDTCSNDTPRGCSRNALPIV